MEMQQNSPRYNSANRYTSLALQSEISHVSSSKPSITLRYFNKLRLLTALISLQNYNNFSVLSTIKPFFLYFCILIKRNIMNLLFLGGIGTGEIILIVLAILLLFGGTKLPELMRGMGKGVKEFKDAMNEPSDDKKED